MVRTSKMSWARADANQSGLNSTEATFMRKAILLTLVVGLCVAGCRSLTHRSVAVSLGASDYNLVFTVAWGWGMYEQFTLQRPGAPFSTASSRRIEIFDKPYNSELAAEI